MCNPHHPLKIALQVVISFTLFTATEYVLDRAGLDTLADYSEFLSGQQESVILDHTFSAENFALPPAIIG
jgi:hypothetical protein